MSETWYKMNNSFIHFGRLPPFHRVRIHRAGPTMITLEQRGYSGQRMRCLREGHYPTEELCRQAIANHISNEIQDAENTLRIMAKASTDLVAYDG